MTCCADLTWSRVPFPDSFRIASPSDIVELDPDEARLHEDTSVLQTIILRARRREGHRRHVLIDTVSLQMAQSAENHIT